MDEVRNILSIILSFIFNSVVLRLAVLLTVLATALFAANTRNNENMTTISDYAAYTAYDNTTIRGQDAVSLIESEVANGDIFVLVYDGSGTNTNINDMSIGSNSPVIAAYPTTRDYTFTEKSNNKTKSSVVNAALSILDSYGSSKTSVSSLVTDKNWGDATSIGSNYNSQLQSLFMNKLGMPGKSGTYAAFKSIIVYSSNSNKDIVGVVLIRQTSYVTTY